VALTYTARVKLKKFDRGQINLAHPKTHVVDEAYVRTSLLPLFKQPVVCVAACV
jgi:hypothetical protein